MTKWGEPSKLATPIFASRARPKISKIPIYHIMVMWGVKIGVFEAAEQLPDVSLSLNPSISPEIVVTPFLSRATSQNIENYNFKYYGHVRCQNRGFRGR